MIEFNKVELTGRPDKRCFRGVAMVRAQVDQVQKKMGEKLDPARDNYHRSVSVKGRKEIDSRWSVRQSQESVFFKI